MNHLVKHGPQRERHFIVYNKGTRYVDGLVPFGVKEIKEFLEQRKNIRSFVCRGAWKAIEEDRKTLRRNYGGFGGQGKISSPLPRPRQRLRISFINVIADQKNRSESWNVFAECTQ